MPAAPALIQEPLVLGCIDSMEEARSVSVGSGTACVYSARSPIKSSANEDGLAVIPAGEDRVVLAVADGVGGHISGEAASEAALSGLVDAIARREGSDEGLRASVLDGLEQANREIVAMNGPATTIAVFEIEGRTVRPYHVGDSVMLIVGNRGKVVYQSVPHSPVGYAVEAGMLDEAEAIHHADRHLVSNVVGSDEMRIEIGSPITLKARDTALIASDGLFDNLHVAEIVEIIRKGTLKQVSRRLAEEAGRRMTDPSPGHPSKPDDLTFIVYRP